MAPKIQPSLPKPVSQPPTTQSPSRPNVRPQSSGPAMTGSVFTSSFTPAGTRPLMSLDGAPVNVPLGSGQPTFRAGGVGSWTGYDTSDEFGYALDAAMKRFGGAAASKLQGVINQIKAGQQPDVSQSVPQPGDIMVWGPNAGFDLSPVGGANGEGHVGVVESVTENADGTSVTIRVSEREWTKQDGVMNGVPYRDITLKRNSDGTLSMPDGEAMPEGVGFVGLNPNAPATTPGNPPLGPNNPPIDKPHFQIHSTDEHEPHLSYSDPSGWLKKNDYKECVGYIHDIKDFGPLIEAWAAAQPPPAHYLPAAAIPTNSTMPQQGALMVWGAGVETPSHGLTYSDGHVAYVEEVQKNYDPPGDSTGTVVSYTITISQANADGTKNDDRSLETFTVPVTANGQPEFPTGVGFYIRTEDSVSTASAPVGNTASDQAPSIQSGTVYVAQSGDTLISIANKADVTLAEILAVNPGITNPDVIDVGQEIHIPERP
jgi:LysM repeat protein